MNWTATPSRHATPAGAAAAAARFTAQARARRRRHWIRAALGLLAAAALLAAAWAVLFSPLLAVREVEVAGTGRLDPAEVTRTAAVPTGGSLALLDTGAIAARVAELAPVDDVDVQRRLPHSVRIVVTEREPAVVLDSPDGRQLVDDEGVTFAPAGDDGRGLPVVTTPGESLPDDAFVGVRDLLAALPAEIRELVRRVHVEGLPGPVLLTAELRDGRVVVWGRPEQAAFKAQVLTLLFSDRPTRKADAFDVSVPEAPAVRPKAD